jgi:putative ABC transport system substrate-binding protein
MQRRVFLAVIATAAVADAQPTRQPKRVGYLVPGAPGQHLSADQIKEFLRQQGYIEGASFIWQERFTAGHNELAEPLARELVAWGPDVIVGGTTPIVVALRKVTQTVPIVMSYVSDPVGAGLITSLAHPGTNVTGATDYGNEIAGKWIQFSREIRPRNRKVGVLTTRDPPHPAQLEAMTEAGHAAGLEVIPLIFEDEASIDATFNRAAAEGCEVVIILGGSRQTPFRKRIADAAIERRICALAINRQYVDVGCIASYGLNHAAHMKLVASYVARILAGARPSDLPVEQPTTFELVLNLKTARSLQIEVPANVLALADQVIQ